MEINNQQIYDENWQVWLDMKVHGPASRWLRSLIRDQISGLPDPQRIRSVLDVGCGEGTITHCLAKWLPETTVVGIDFSKSGIELAQRRYTRPNLRFIHDESSEQLQQRFDLVSAFEVLEHVEPWQDLLGRMAECANQHLLLSFPTGRMRPFEKAVGHFRNFKPGEVEEFLAGKGFEATRTFYAGFPFYSPIYRELCNITDAASNSFTTGSYGPRQKLVAQVFYSMFRFLSTRRRLGDQFCGLFARR